LCFWEYVVEVCFGMSVAALVFVAQVCYYLIIVYYFIINEFFLLLLIFVIILFYQLLDP